MICLQQIITQLYDLAPEWLAFDWDNIGLQVGSYEQNINKILISLDVTAAVLEEAINNKCQLIVSHHPLIFKQIKSINNHTSLGKIITKAIKNDISIFSIHTNLDIANGGLNDYLAKKLNLLNCCGLQIVNVDEYYKLVVFIPENFFEDVKEAILNVGAGHIGNYSHTSYACKGQGTFKPLVGSNPFIGKKEELTRVREIRFETIISKHSIKNVVNTILKVHPYEEVAYDIYPLANEGQKYSLGRVGKLVQRSKLKDILIYIKERLNLKIVKFVGSKEKYIEKVAVCSGSGADLIRAAKEKKADLLITGDVKYHEAQFAEELGLALIDAGHYETEIIVKELLSDYLIEKKLGVEVVQSKVNTNPWNYA